jgi:hypothetical protein
MNLLRLFRNGDGSTRRLQPRRRPIVEALEGRQLLSGIAGRHIGNSAAVAEFRVGSHIGTGAAAGVLRQGGHLGAMVSSPDYMRKH